MKKIIIASGNQGKIRELRVVLEPAGWEIAGLESCPGIKMPPENGGSFVANARIKAQAVRNFLLRDQKNDFMPWILADDSGLCCEGLGGHPGVESANFAGLQASDEANNQKLMQEFRARPGCSRKAFYECVLILLSPEGAEKNVCASCAGEIIDTPRGLEGFGYDAYFFLPEFQKTMAEISLELKNQISHRGKALRRLTVEFIGIAHEG